MLLTHFIDEKMRFKEAHKQVAKAQVESLFYSSTVFFPESHAGMLDPQWRIENCMDGTFSFSFQLQHSPISPYDQSLEEGSFLYGL